MGFLILTGMLSSNTEVVAMFQSVERPVSSSQRDLRPLEPGKAVEASLDAGQSHHYSLALETNQYVRLIVESDKDVIALLVAPSGKRLLREDTRYHSTRVLTPTCVTEESGNYNLEISSPGKAAAPGRYRLTVGKLRAATDEDRKLLAAGLTFGEARKLAGQPGQSTAESLRLAIEKYKEALHLFRELGDRNSEGHTLSSIAGIYNSLNEYHTARDFYTHAISLYQAVGDRAGESRALYGLAFIYRDLGEYQRAIEHINSALSALRIIGDRRNEAFALMAVGNLHSILGEDQKTIGLYDQALSLFRATGDRRGEANSLNLIASFLLSQNEPKKALELYNQGLAIYRAFGDRRGEADSLTGLGRVHTALNENREAREFYDQALQLHISAGSRRGEAHTHFYIGRSYFLLGEHQKSLEHLTRALELSRAVKERRTQGAAAYDIARVQRALGNLTEAHSHSEAAVRIAESLRHQIPGPDLRASFFASVQKYYELEAEVLMQLHKARPAEGFDSAALAVSERARARSFLELLAEARAEIRHGVGPALLEQERSLGQMLNARAESQTQLLSGKHTPEQAAAAAREVDSLLSQYQEMQSQIRASSPRYAALTQPQTLTLNDIQQLLDGDTLLLEYGLGDERSYLWAVRKGSLTTYELPKRSEIEDAVRRFYELVKTDSGTSKVTEAAQELSQILLPPVAAGLGLKRLAIVPDGVLHYLPFAALPSPDASGKGLSKGQGMPERPPLIVEHEIVTLPSASVLAEMRRDLAGRKAAAKAVAVFADPVFTSDDPRLQPTAEKGQRPADTRSLGRDLERAMRDVGASEGFARLPFSRREAEAISTIAPVSEAMKALDFQASRSAAFSNDLSQYRIVHFATHGLLNSNHPELSGIVLSLVDREGRTQNGFLRLHDVYNLKLPAELVVLSACQTALGKEIRGEGLVGLTRGFMYAGAPRVVAGLWKVDDAATAELMKRFYRGMFARGLRPAAALREAQVEMWKQRRWRQPYYWAAFVIQGEWK
jgi:CHAT domain-containing protein